MSKGLEALKELKEQSKTHRWLEQQFENEWLDIIKKELKALEIINKKNVKIDMVKYHSQCIFYNTTVFEKENKLTQEEYDLLKEVLINEKETS